MTKYPKLSQLGRPAGLPDSPEKAVLETVPNRESSELRWVAEEDVAELPLHPGFAASWERLREVAIGERRQLVEVDYAPRERLVESKSLKLYLGSFRNHADFHEACTLAIGMRLAKVLAPRWLRIGGYWYPRGGMPIDVFWQTGRAPKDLWIPDQGVAPYRGRG